MSSLLHLGSTPPPPRGLPFRALVGSPRWIGSLAALTGMTALSIDMSLPAQPTLMREFGVGSDRTQLTLSLFLLGYAIGQLIVGYVSDALGRRRLLLAGLAVFSLAGLACAITTNLSVLIALRFVQGTGAASGTVIARAMVRDTHAGSEAARLFATMTAVLCLAPMLAPIVGGFLLVHLGWRAIFTTLGLCGIALGVMTALSLEETLAERRPLALGAIASSVGRFFRTRGTRGPSAVIALSFAAQFAFISGSPFVLIDGYKVEPSHYGFYFGATALALMAGSAAGGRLLKTGRPTRRVVTLGGLTLFVAALALAALVQVPAAGVLGLMVPVVGCFVGIGLVVPSSAAMAMEPVPEIAGTASALIGFLQMVAGSVSGYVIAKIGGSNPRTLGLQVAILALACAAMVFRPRRASS
ncbi:multidrug effflux MFS transporter [Pendulispora albinea]|uniref:Multidrug effflux MFS transporter n=1 Tax=Pendulispora albinea TaxID=2741071 RepID=A0ABZ2M8A5_9BACT